MKNPIDLAAEAAAFADQYQMLPQGSTVLCAVSGGKDSMALLSVLQTLAPERTLMIPAAHFNHQLRGEASQRDEDFVSKWCADHNIPLTIGSGDVAQAAQEQGKGIEETARAMRYGFLTETAQEVGAEKIATAHNADDNAETVLLHLIRGTGLDGLTGMIFVYKNFCYFFNIGIADAGDIAVSLILFYKSGTDNTGWDRNGPYSQISDADRHDTAQWRDRIDITVAHCEQC